MNRTVVFDCRIQLSVYMTFLSPTKKLYQPHSVLRLKHVSVSSGHTCIWCYSLTDSVNSHIQRSRGIYQQTWSPSIDLCWTDEAFFVHCFCSPCSCMPVNNPGGGCRSILKKKHCGSFPAVPTVFSSLCLFFTLSLISAPTHCTTGGHERNYHLPFSHWACCHIWGCWFPYRWILYTPCIALLMDICIFWFSIIVLIYFICSFW